MKNIIKILKVVLMPGSIAGILTVLFLSGKIIDYPGGTPKGGVIAATGVLVILVFTVAINYLIYLLNNKYKQSGIKEKEIYK